MIQALGKAQAHYMRPSLSSTPPQPLRPLLAPALSHLPPHAPSSQPSPLPVPSPPLPPPTLTHIRFLSFSLLPPHFLTYAFSLLPPRPPPNCRPQRRCLSGDEVDGLNFLYPSCAPFAYNGSFLPPCTYEARGAIISLATGMGELVVWRIGGVRIGEEGWRLLGCSRVGW